LCFCWPGIGCSFRHRILVPQGIAWSRVSLLIHRPHQLVQIWCCSSYSVTFCGSGHYRCMKYQGRILDLEYISEHVNQGHQRARANRMHNWVRVDFVDLDEYLVDTVMQRRYSDVDNEAERNRVAMQGKVDFFELYEELE
jgi:hypothetical protein